jgi:iron-sulfur cluster insertion protein
MSHSDQMKFSSSAARKVYELIKEEDNFNLNLRVYITGGGCSGFQYGFTFDEERQEGDIEIPSQVEVEGSSEAATVLLLVDTMSYQYLMDAEIDYQEDVQGARFIIRNPNAKTTCGCGSSFSV